MIKQPFVAKLEILLINNRNKNGPRTDPCGTPDEISTNNENFPLQTTACWRWCKYDLNHSSSIFLIPYSESFFNHKSWSIVSKHFAMSNIQIPVIWLSFTFSSQSSIALCRLVWVEWPFRYANWSGVIKECSFKYVTSWLRINCSTIFAICPMTDIGL